GSSAPPARYLLATAVSPYVALPWGPGQPGAVGKNSFKPGRQTQMSLHGGGMTRNLCFTDCGPGRLRIMLGSLAADAPHAMAAVPASAATVSAGGCAASPLPLDTTCSGAARRLFRAAAAGGGLSPGLRYDGSTMASELPAHSVRAQN